MLAQRKEILLDKRVAILQSNYIPWKGYFDIIQSVDEFILFDTAQYTKRDWRNRNLIKTAQGPVWITIPVEVKGKFDQPICEVRVTSSSWADKHIRMLQHTYSQAKHFKETHPIINDWYTRAKKYDRLSDINHFFIIQICKLLNIQTKISWSNDYLLKDGKTEKLVGLCEAAGASVYLSGPSAKDYIDQKQFEEKNIQLKYMSYDGYPTYDQLYGKFEHGVSILDMLYNLGNETPQFLTRKLIG